MFTYSFEAKNPEGSLVSGDIEADHRQSAITILKQKGYYLLGVKRQNRLIAVFTQNLTLANRVSVKDKAIFSHQLATLLKAGMKLTSALNTLSRQTGNKYLASVIEKMQTDIEQSSSLSEAMNKYPQIFSKVYTAIIEAAEQSGGLAETLTMLSSQLKSQATVNARVKAALAYPIFLLFVSTLVVGLLTTFVIPKFIELFVNSSQNLPLSTRILVLGTNSIKDFWLVPIFMIIGIVCFIMVALRNERTRLAIDSTLLSLPIIGTLNQKLQLARFARTLGSLLNGGVRIISAIHTTRGTTKNSAFAAEIDQIEREVVRGSTLARAISQQRYFGEIAVNMITVGEDTGTLPEMLLEVAQMQDQECESAINSMTGLLGPFMIVVMGLIIGFVVMAILMPIFETSTMID